MLMIQKTNLSHETASWFKVFFILTTICFASLSVSGQDIIQFILDDNDNVVELWEFDDSEVGPDSSGVYSYAETMPEFPDGLVACLNWLNDHIVYPEFCLKNKIQGRVRVSFVVDTDGSILSPEVQKGVYVSLDKEAVRVVSSMPKWKPGKVNNKPVKVRYWVPVVFRLPDTNISTTDNTMPVQDGQTEEDFMAVKEDQFEWVDIAEADHVSVEEEKPDYVDLGLSVLWSTCNVGAETPEQFGGYYSFGETETKQTYTWGTYKWCEGTETSLTRYNYNPTRGKIDYLNVIKPDDDAAHAKLGGGWRIPTEKEWEELLENCTWILMADEKGYGYKITGKKEGYKDRSIYLPAAGVRNGSDLYASNAYYWSATTGFNNADGLSKAWFLYFNKTGKTMALSGYFNGMPIRPVCEKNTMVTTFSVIDNIQYGDTTLNDYDIIEQYMQDEEEELFMVVEERPEYPGGYTALLEFLRKNIKYPAVCRDNNIQGRVIVSFTVEKDGSITDIAVKSGVHPALDAEAIRITSLMPKWKPGQQKGKPVRVKYSMPINFRLQ